MDRDYTTEKESQCSELIEMLETENNTLTFQHPFNEAYIPTFNVHNENYQSIYAQNYNYYESSFYQMMNVFEQVRKFDQTSAAGETIQEELNTLKETMQQVRELLKLPNIGTSASEVNYNLGRYGSDVALAGSIFGDCISYTDGVAAVGFGEQAENSRAYLERELQNLMYVDENGKEIYNMELILEILSRDAKDISQAQYGAIAAAYLQMDADDMEKIINVMMYCDEESLKWQLDEGKYESMTAGVSKVLGINLQAIEAHDQKSVDQKSVDQKISHEEKASRIENQRKKFVQRAAVLEAIKVIDGSTTVKMGEDGIKLEVDENKGYLLSFYEIGRVENLLQGGMRDILHKSTISIGVGRSAVDEAYASNQDIAILLHNQFANGYTSDGFVDATTENNFLIQHVGQFMRDELFNIYFAQESLQNVSLAASSMYSAIQHYNAAIEEKRQGKQNAKFIQDIAADINCMYVYQIFGCDAVSIQYNTVEFDNVYCHYAESGRYTNTRVDYFRNNYPGANQYTTESIINRTDQVYETLGEWIENEYSFQDIQMAGRKKIGEKEPKKKPKEKNNS